MRGSSLRSGLLTLALALAIPAQAQAPTNAYQPFQQPTGAQVPPVVILCATGTNRDALPCGSMAAPLNVMTAPFVRAVPDPIIFDGVTTTPKQFAIAKPPAATTYRFVNPCDVDVRIKKVGSLTETITATTGILYLARTVEVIGTSNPSFISVMAMAPPSKPCAPELLYGNGS